MECTTSDTKLKWRYLEPSCQGTSPEYFHSVSFNSLWRAQSICFKFWFYRLNKTWRWHFLEDLVLFVSTLGIHADLYSSSTKQAANFQHESQSEDFTLRQTCWLCQKAKLWLQAAVLCQCFFFLIKWVSSLSINSPEREKKVSGFLLLLAPPLRTLFLKISPAWCHEVHYYHVSNTMSQIVTTQPKHSWQEAYF